MWASAPYLHNASVPTLWDLLTDADKRPRTFYIGNREFDPVKVGYVSAPGGPHSFLMDTSRKGNGNGGHTGDREQPEAHDHVADLADDVERQDPLDVVLGDGTEHTDHHRQPGDGRSRRRGPVRHRR